MTAIKQDINHPDLRQVILEDASPLDLCNWLIKELADYRNFFFHTDRKLHRMEAVLVTDQGDKINFDEAWLIMDRNQPMTSYVIDGYRYFLTKQT